VTFEPAPNQPGLKPMNPLLKLALELGPLAVFFFANARGAWLAEKIPPLAALGGPLFVGTALFVVATVISLVVSLVLTRRLPIMPVVSGIVVLIFGGLALWLHDDRFIKMKPTIINGLFGGALLVGLLFGKSLLGYVFDSAFRLTDEGWRMLTLRWGVFLLFLAVLNEVVWRVLAATMPPERADSLWVDFKVFGLVGLTFLFTLSQLPMINRYALPEEGKPAP
jgi:intracellular septation protein